jgi:hypothetical protein
MSIQKLGQALRPDIAVEDQLFASTDNYLASIIVTNVDANNPGKATIYITPFGSSNQDNWAYILHEIEIEPNNSLETHRFAIDPGDQVFVSSNSGNISFVMTGIRQTAYKSSLPQTFYNKTISGEFNTINNLPNSSLINSQIILMGEQMDLGETVPDLDYLQLDISATPASSVGRMTWNDGFGTLSLGLKGGNIDLPVGQENVVLCKNSTAEIITKGSVVYINGAQGQRPRIALSSASSESTSSKTLGVVSENIGIGSEGFVTTFGVLKGIDTSSFTEGAALWLSTTAGQLTQTPPQTPNHSVFVGYCVKSNQSSGQIFVEIQNGYEIEELHNVLITSVQDGDYLTYNSSTSLWENTSLQIYPDQTGNENKFLKTDGTNVVWETVPASLPSQTGNAGYYLTTDGNSPSWVEIDFTQFAGTDSPTFTGTVTLPSNVIYTNSVEIDSATTVDISSFKKYFVNTLTNTTTLRLPASPSLGDEIEIFDATNNATANNITVSSNGQKIEGSVQDFIIDMSADRARLVYTGSNFGWAVIV